MAQTDPNAAAQKWASNLGAATQRIQSGVEAVTTSPGQLAARQAQVWVQNTQAAQQKFASNSSKVTLAQWQTATVSKGLPRIASGATAAEPKFAAFMTSFLPFVNSQVSSLPARGGLEQNIARSAAMIRAMTKFPGYTKP